MFNNLIGNSGAVGEDKSPNALHMELFIAREYWKLIQRQPSKFIKYAIRDYVLRWTRIVPALSPAYLTCRIADDIADGECELPDEFESYPEFIQIAQEQISSGVVRSRSNFMYLLQYAIQTTSKRQMKQGETEEAYAKTLDAMLAEFQRRIERKLLSPDELVSVHTASSYHPHNIGLICLGSRNRASDTPELSELIGRMDALRDMPKDLRLGIVNVPIGVMHTANCSYGSLVDVPSAVYSHPAIIEWMRGELVAGGQLIDRLTGCEVDRTADLILSSRLKRRIPFVRENFPKFLDEVTNVENEN